jgi:hypothetical protein
LPFGLFIVWEQKWETGKKISSVNRLEKTDWGQTAPQGIET